MMFVAILLLLSLTGIILHCTSKNDADNTNEAVAEPTPQSPNSTIQSTIPSNLIADKTTVIAVLFDGNNTEYAATILKVAWWSHIILHPIESFVNVRYEYINLIYDPLRMVIIRHFNITTTPVIYLITNTSAHVYILVNTPAAFRLFIANELNITSRNISQFT